MNIPALIAREGQSVTITRRTGSAFDPATGQVAATETSPTADVVAVSITRSDDIFFKPESIIGGRARVVLSADEIQQGDVIPLDGDDYTIIGVSVVSPAGTPLLYRARGER